MSQSSYVIDQAPALEGMLSDTTQHKDVLSLNNKDALAYIGKVVCKATGEDEIKHPALATDITDLKAVRGVVLHNHALESQNDGLAPNYPRYSAVNVLHKGRMWVVFEDAPAVGTQPSVRFSGVGQAGAFKSAPVVGETALLPNSKVLATAPGNFALIEIDL